MDDARPSPGMAGPAAAVFVLAIVLTQLGFFSAIASDACMGTSDPGACESAMMPGVYLAGGAPIPLFLVGVTWSWRRRRSGAAHPSRPLAYAALAMVIAFGLGIAWVYAHTP